VQLVDGPVRLACGRCTYPISRARCCKWPQGRVIRPERRVLSLAMSALGWVVVAAILIIVLVLVVVFVRRRRRGGVIATRDKE
jgi:disulfide bond formation protein DsbB